jgi:hypothetical protein
MSSLNKRSDTVGEPLSAPQSRAFCRGCSKLLGLQRGHGGGASSALRSSPTVAHELAITTADEKRFAIFRRVSHRTPIRMISCGKWAPLKLIAMVALPPDVLDHLSGRSYLKCAPNETCDRTGPVNRGTGSSSLPRSGHSGSGTRLRTRSAITPGLRGRQRRRSAGAPPGSAVRGQAHCPTRWTGRAWDWPP